MLIPQQQLVYRFKFSLFKELVFIFEKNLPSSVVLERRYSVELIGNKYQVTILLTDEEKKVFLKKFLADMAEIEKNSMETQKNEYIPSYLPQPENFQEFLERVKQNAYSAAQWR